MNFSKRKWKGEIGVRHIWQMIDERPTATFAVIFVRSKADGLDKPAGELVERVVRYGAPPHEKARDRRDLPSVPLVGSIPQLKRRNVAKHEHRDTIPVYYPDSLEYRSLLISHILVWDGYKVNL